MYMKFAPLNLDFSSLSHDFLRSRRPAHAEFKKGYSPKKWLFSRH